MKNYVVALRQFEQPHTADAFTELTYLSLDRERMMSIYESDDVDAVREAQTLPLEAVFQANMWREMLGLSPGAAVGDRSVVIIERPPATATVQELLERARRDYAPCFNANNIDLVDSYMPVQSGSVGGVCVYAAPDADTVRRANRTVGYEFIRAWTTNVYEPA